jgi:hypothetical protein
MGELIMYGLTGRTVRPAAPGPSVGIAVVPGRETDPQECSACRSMTAPAAHSVVDGIELALCLDFAGCAARYRGGTSPSSYAAALRGELLGVAP